MRTPLALSTLAAALCALACGEAPNPATNSAASSVQQASQAFQGDVQLDIRNSKPDWAAFLPKKAPKDAPNVLVILYDDTGLATWSTYGGRVNMPTRWR